MKPTMKYIANNIYRNTEAINKFCKRNLDELPDLIFNILIKNNLEYSVCFCNEAVNEIYEFSVEEFIQNPFNVVVERVLPEYLEEFINVFFEARKNKQSWEYEYKVNLPKKGIRWLKITSKPQVEDEESLFYFCKVSDITELKEKEHELQVSKERFQFALKAASEGVWDWNRLTDEVYFSAQSMKILGEPEKEKHADLNFWDDKIHPEDKQHYLDTMAAHIKGETSVYECIYRIQTKGGHYRWVLSRGRAVEFDSDWKPARCIGTHKDITLLKEKEIELGRTINIIGDQNNRLVNFAHIVSHNLRSHSGNLKMLLDLYKNADEDEKKEMFKNLEAISSGLSITIAHLKELVDIQFDLKTAREKLNLRRYLKNILNILHKEINKYGINIEINIPLNVTVNYNPAYLESILLNFTTNAIKYSSPERKSYIYYNYENKNGVKTLSITDNGLGIDLKKHQNSLFGMYKTFHRNQNSRGIGLFITKNQVEAMGGRIEVISKVNKGTTFKIYFNEED